MHKLPTGTGIDAPPLAGKSVALVHEWFTARGGSENVFVAISEILPHAQGFVLWRDADAEQGSRFTESWLAHTPLRHTRALALSAMPITWRTLTREHFDVVISSSHAFAHTVKLSATGDTRYLSYIHSPARYLWSPNLDERGSTRLLTLPRKALRAADRHLGRHIDSYACNSLEVRARIRRFWHRDARVIHPPVDVAYFAAAAARPAPQRDYLLGVGRWVAYKKFDLMIEIAEAARVPLVIAGAGPEEAALRRAADRSEATVTFELRPSRERLRELYQGARALLFPAHEDFGIVPVEAQAAGTPVVGVARGGLRETVVDGVTGFLLDTEDPQRYAAALRDIDDLDHGRIRAHAGRFSVQRFNGAIISWLTDEAG